MPTAQHTLKVVDGIHESEALGLGLYHILHNCEQLVLTVYLYHLQEIDDLLRLSLIEKR